MPLFDVLIKQILPHVQYHFIAEPQSRHVSGVPVARGYW